MDIDLKESLKSASILTHAIGRRIVSPKNDLTDLDDLVKALQSVASTVTTIRNIQHIRDSE